MGGSCRDKDHRVHVHDCMKEDDSLSGFHVDRIKERSHLQIKRLSRTRFGKKCCIVRKTAPGKRIMPNKPPPRGAITSFVAIIGSGRVHPWVMICAHFRYFSSRRPDRYYKRTLTHVLQTTRNAIWRFDAIGIHRDFGIKQSKCPRINNTDTRCHRRVPL